MSKEEQKNVMFKKIVVNSYEDEEGQSAQVLGVYSHPKSQQNTPLKTSKIQTHQATYGVETELKKLLTKLSTEASAYVIDGKSSQMKLELKDVA